MNIFFFQAEDGIRDTSVTGVQTCALPICSWSDVAGAAEPVVRDLHPAPLAARAAVTIDAATGDILYAQHAFDELPPASLTKRSEERRVGKECRATCQLTAGKKSKQVRLQG